MKRSYSYTALLAGLMLFTACPAHAAGQASESPALEMPLPLGAGVTVHWQSQDYDLNRLKLNGTDLTALTAAPDLELDIENEVSEVNLKLDYWLLPFLNVFGLVGRVDGETEVNLNTAALIGLRDLLQGLPLEQALAAFQQIEYEGIVYGGGVTVAGGMDRYFAAVNLTYTDTDLDTTTSSVKAWVLTPKVGMTWQYGAVWLGAMYQEYDESHQVVFENFTFDAVLEQKEAWNYTVGLATALGANWHFEAEGGFGDRSHATLNATYRF